LNQGQLTAEFILFKVLFISLISISLRYHKRRPSYFICY